MAVTLGPAFSGRPGHLITLGGPGDGPALINDQTRQPKTTTRSQSSVSVGHEGLLLAERFLDSSTPQPEAFTRHTHSDRVVTQPQPISLGSTPRERNDLRVPELSSRNSGVIS